MGLTCLSGCAQSASTVSNTEFSSGGILVLRVNPEIAVEYDEKGLVTGVSARNDEAIEIISSCKGLIGQKTRDVISKLVSAIGEAGYFLEEIENERKQITIEIEAGSKLPHDNFLDEVVFDVRDCVEANSWNVPMEVANESDYGITDYGDTDYGPNNDGVTDDNDGNSNYSDGQSNYDSDSNYGSSDYDD